MKQTRIALIPAYEPEPLMLKLLQEARNSGFDIVVVNDGSSKEKENIFHQAKEYAVVLKHAENMGKGRAIKTGLSYIRRHYVMGYVVVTMDADGQHKVKDAEKICRIAEDQSGKLVLGSRRLSENVPFKSRFGNTITRFVYRFSTGLKVHDTQTGLRAFSSHLVPEFLMIPGERYEYEMNVLLECSRKNIPIREVEIATIYIDGNATSHFDAVKDSYRIYKEILKFSASSFVSFLIDYGLYSLLTIMTGNLGSSMSLTVSNVGARIVSASVNYTLNRKMVFQSETGIAKSAAQYFILAACILTGNTIVLGCLIEQFGINRYLAKLCTELFFFLMSWMVQRYFIFCRKETVQEKGGS